MPEVNYRNLKKTVNSNSGYNLYLLEGDIDLVNHFENKILNNALGEKYSDFDFNLFKGENLSLEKLSLSLQTFPLTSKTKCVIIKNLEWENLSSEDMEELLTIISDVPIFIVLIITQTSKIIGTKNTSKFKKIQSFVKANGIYSNLSQKDISIEKQLISWAKEEYGKELSTLTAKKIKELCLGYSIGEIKNELKKICEFETAPCINDDSLKIIWKSKASASVFDLPKALFKEDALTCFKVLDDLFSQKEEPFSILAVIGNEYIDIYRVKVFLELGKNFEEVSEIFDYKRKEFRLKNAYNRCKKLKMQSIKNSFRHLIEADLKLKSSLLDFKTIISELIVLLLEELKS